MGQWHIFQISQAMDVILEQWTGKEKGGGAGTGIVSGTQLSEAPEFHWRANQVPPPSSTTTTLTYTPVTASPGGLTGKPVILPRKSISKPVTLPPLKNQVTWGYLAQWEPPSILYVLQLYLHFVLQAINIYCNLIKWLQTLDLESLWDLFCAYPRSLPSYY